MDRFQDITINDASLKALFISYFLNGQYGQAFNLITNNAQLNTKAFVANVMNEIAGILSLLQENFNDEVILYLENQLFGFQIIIDNYLLKNDYDGSTEYQIYNFVIYNDLIYMYINSDPSTGNLPTDTDYWVEIGLLGQKGEPGIGVNLRYTWDSLVTYNPLDVVYYDNELWVATIQNTNVTPGTETTWQTLTGSIVTVDNPGNYYVGDLVVDINPIQDLNGYDHPWPAGGGKNLFDPTLFADQAAWKQGTIQLKPNTTYVCSSDMPSAGTLLYINDNAGGFAAGFQVYTGHPAVFTTGAEGLAKYQLRISDGTSSFSGYKTQLELGSTATAYSPYSNVCPIAGRAGTKVYNDPAHGGLIRWNQTVYDVEATGGTKTISDGIVSVHPTGSANRLRAKSTATIAGHKYFEAVTIKSDGEHSVGFQNYLFPGTLKTASASWTVLEDIQTAASTGNPYVQLYSVSNTDYQIKQGSFMFFDLTEMFGAGKEPTTVQEFRALFPKESYAYNEGEPMTVSAVNGDPYTLIPISWEEEAGTVYGGELDVTTGELTVDRKKITLTWGTGGTSLGTVTRKSISLGEYVKAETQGFIPTSSVSKYLRNYVSDTTHFYTDGTQLLMFLPNDTPADTTFEVVYWPATPQTYQLTPQEVQLLAGENNLWSDTGDIEVEIVERDWEEFLEFSKASLYIDSTSPSSPFEGMIWFDTSLT